MKPRIWKGFGLVLLLAILAPYSTRAENNNKGGDDNNFRFHHIVKRQQDIGEFKTVVCNRTIWKSTFEPYLQAERELQRDPKNEDLKMKFDSVLKDLNRWKDTNLQRLDVLCGLQRFLECGEDLKCICGTGGAPYSYEAKDASTCVAKRGSVCLIDSDCAVGLFCQERYCGGSAAFLEESKGISNAPGFVTTTLISAIVISFIFFRIICK